MPKILVVDDSATVRKIVIKGVQDAGFKGCQCLEAGDGAEALEALEKHDFALILCDVNMPNVNGLQLVRRVRDPGRGGGGPAGPTSPRGTGRSVPIVMISTEAGLETMQAALAAGANAYLQKPFTPEQLREKIAPFLC